MLSVVTLISLVSFLFPEICVQYAIYHHAYRADR